MRSGVCSRTRIVDMFYFLLLSVVASDALVQDPGILVVKHGQEIHLSCPLVSTSNSADWYHTPVGSPTPQRVNHLSPVFKNSTLSGRNLTILAAQVDHAGLYRCSMKIGESGNIRTAEIDAYVVVLTTDPVCNIRPSVTIPEDAKFEAACIVSYAGNFTPTIKWKKKTAENEWQDVNATLISTPTQSSSILSYVADFSLNGAEFRCQTTFGVNYNYTWISPPLQVLYGPRNLTVNLSGDSLYSDEQLTCHAEGNPIPEVQWINLETKEIKMGSILSLGDHMVRTDPHNFSCRATSSATNKTVELPVKFFVRERKIGETRITVFLLGGLLLLTVVIAAIIIACLSVYISRRSRKRWQSEDCNKAQTAIQHPYETSIDIRGHRGHIRNYETSRQVPRVYSNEDNDYLRPSSFISEPYHHIDDILKEKLVAQGINVDPTSVYMEVVSDSGPLPLPSPKDRRQVNDYLIEESSVQSMVKPTPVYESLIKTATN